MKLPALLASLVLAAATAAAGEPAANLIAEADSYWAAGRLDQAQQSFEAAAAAEPRSAVALLRLAGFQLARQQTSASIATYQRVVGLDANNVKAWLGLGLAYLHGGDKPLARACLEQAVQLDPRQKEALAEVLANLEGN